MGSGAWESLVAVAVVAGDPTESGIARYAGIHASDAAAALAMAWSAGVFGEDGAVVEAVANRLVGGLDPDRVAEAHAAAARHLFSAGPGVARDALAHARSAGALLGPDELLGNCDRVGSMALELGDYPTAQEFLDAADSIDHSGDTTLRVLRLCDLARATMGLGDVHTARAVLARAAHLADAVDDPLLSARIAIQYALPTEWNAGDSFAIGLLERIDTDRLDIDGRVAVTAARALTEMRIPLASDGSQQISWVARHSVSRSLAQEALDLSVSSGPMARSMALFAWRATHRAPEFLDSRLPVSTEALETFQKLRFPTHQIEAAIGLAVDAIESGDRAEFDRSVAIAQWIADHDGNPSVRFRALALAAGAAHLDGDHVRGVELSKVAIDIGTKIDAPGLLGASLSFVLQDITSRGAVDELHIFLDDESLPEYKNPLRRAAHAYAATHAGDLDGALRHARLALRSVDPELSYLFVGTRLAASAVLIGDAQFSRDLIAMLDPWEERVSVHSAGWWCDGPVSLALASLHNSLGEEGLALGFLDRADPIILATGDSRSMVRSGVLRASLSGPVGRLASIPGLTTRERTILGLLATGATNPQIADALSFSLSTIRTDTVSIYRKLGVNGRSEAVAIAVKSGLFD